MGFGNKVVGLEFGACLWFRFWVGSSGFRSGVEGLWCLKVSGFQVWKVSLG